MNANNELVIDVVCDNEVKAPGIQGDNSISLLINGELMIDTCSSTERLLGNMKAMGINANPRLLVISTPINHHWGGLDALAGVAKVVIPIDSTVNSFELRDRLDRLGFDVIEVGGRERFKLGFGSVELIRVGNKRVGELLIYIPGHKLLISGCGLNLWLIDDDQLLRFFKELDIRHFVGGLGATSTSEYQGVLLRDVIRNLASIYPLHGTGPKLRRELVSNHRNAHDVGAGSIVRIG